MELYEKVELAMWSLRRTIDRARYLELATAQLAEQYVRRRQAERLPLGVFWVNALEDAASAEEDVPTTEDEEDPESHGI